MLQAQRNASANTLDAYRRDLTQFLGWARAHKLPIEKLLESDLQNYLISLSQKNHLAPASAARKLSSLRHFFRYLASEHIRDDNPSTHLDAPRQGRTLPDSLTKQEMQILLDTAAQDETIEGARLYAMLQILYAAGLRVSELVGLRLEQLDKLLDSEGNENYFLLISGKGGKERLAPLNNQAMDALNNYLRLLQNDSGEGISRHFCTENRSVAALHEDLSTKITTKLPARIILQQPHLKKLNKKPLYLFPSAAAQGHITRQFFGKLLRELGRKTCIDEEKLHPHALRHSFASHLLAGGADLRVVQTLLGHADISTTQIYTHILPEHLQELVQTHHPLAKL